MSDGGPAKIRNVEIGGKKYKVEIAETERQKIRGLMGVKHLPKNEGMLFMYDEP